MTTLLTRELKILGTAVDRYLTIWFLVKGPHGVVQWVMDCGPKHSSGWAIDLGYHAYEPQFPDHKPMDDCEFLDGKPCYYDGSTTFASDWVPTFVTHGSDGIWPLLEQYYRATFEGGEYPSVDNTAVEKKGHAHVE